jgi:putative ABC transport system permease protein
MAAMIRANLLRRWGRTALSGLGVAIGVTTIVALLALTAGLARSAGDLAKLGRADFGVFQGGLADLTASSLPDAVVPRVQAVPGVAAVAPLQILSHAVAADSTILVFGARAQSFLAKRLVLLAGRDAAGTGLMVGTGAASRLHVRPGQRLSIDGHLLRVAGIYHSGISLEDNGIVLPLALTQRISGRPGEISIIVVLIAPGYLETTVEHAVQRAVPGTVALGDPSEVSRVDTNSRTINEAAIIIAVLAVLLGAVVVVNTMALAVIERRREFGVLAAVGWSRGRIARLLLGESIAVSLAGTVLGLGVGALASVLLVHALAAATFVSPAITPWVLGRGLLVGLALGVLGSLFALWQVLRVPTIDALQRR